MIIRTALPVLLTLVAALHASADEPKVPQLVRQLAAKEVEARWAAARELIGLGVEKAAPTFIQALGSKDARVREVSAWSLGELAPRPEPFSSKPIRPTPTTAKAITALQQALDDKQVDVAEMAALCLGKYGELAAPTLPALMRALRHRAQGVRMATINALMQVGPHAVPPLTRALRSRDAAVRWAAAFTLGGLGHQAARAMPALKRLRADPDKKVAEAAAASLSSIQASVKAQRRQPNHLGPKTR